MEILVNFTILFLGLMSVCYAQTTTIDPGSTNETKTITIGFLAPDDTTVYRLVRFNGGAMTVAVRDVNRNPDLLPGYELKFRYMDTHGNEEGSIRALTDLWRNGNVAFIGPGLTCTTEAKVSAALNLPMISYFCKEPAVSDKENYRTFARTVPTTEKVAESVLALLDQFDWKVISVVAARDPQFSRVMTRLEKFLPLHGVRVQHALSYENPYYPMYPIKDNRLKDIIDQSFADTRIYVFIPAEPYELHAFLEDLGEKGLLNDGKYFVVAIFFKIFDETFREGLIRGFDYPAENITQRIQYLHNVIMLFYTSVMSPDYNEFKIEAKEYLSLPPFNFNSTLLEGEGFHIEITEDAAYIYDAVMLYANALNQTLSEGGNITNGADIIDNILGKPYQNSLEKSVTF
ncbi:guanylate cyclase 32E-like [Lytechinus pictus]|uniref:guanylate cyclase 32E-like n=1 Tax=Lytechinus pictus TaxID=7653 RepID=UPI0030B9DA57